MRNKSRAFLLYYRTDTHADEQEGLVRKGAAHSLEETMEWYHTPALSPEPAQTPATWLRVCTFGRFQIEWVDPATGERTPLPAERMQGQNAGTALGLFKALLTRPDRFATRSWLLEQFWPESRQRAAEERLNDVVSSLRGLLRPPGCTQMFVHFVHGANGRGAGYRLDAYPHLWCDADAFAWYVTHALLLDQRGHDATALWERAYALAARGEYLPEQIEDEWSQQQREYLHGLLRDCVHRWTEVLRQRGCGEEAIVRLRGYWLAHPTDEDALRPLLELLGERERFGEAEEVYARAQAALAEDGCEPETRTVETMETVRALQVRRPLLKGMAIQTSSALAFPTELTVLQPGPFPVPSPLILPLSPQQPSFLPLVALFKESPSAGSGEEWSVWAGLKEAQLMTLIDGWPGNGVYYEQLQAILDRELLVFQTISPNGDNKAALSSRRQVLIALAMSPTTLTTLSQHILSKSMVNLMLARCAASITALWHLLKGIELSLVEQILSAYLLTLVTLAHQPSPDQKEAAKLTSQAYRLLGIVALHRNNLQAREYYCQQAILFSKIAEEKSLIVSAYTSLASTLYYLKQPERATSVYQEALALKESISPLQRSRLYAELAVVLAQQQREHEALEADGLAQQWYPEHPDYDPSFLYTEFSPSSRILEEGLTYLALARGFPGRHYEQEAWQCLSRIETVHEKGSVPQRILYEVINRQAEAALLLGERDLFLKYLDNGLQGAKILKSRQRQQEIQDIYAQAESVWPTEQTIKERAPLVSPSVFSPTEKRG